MSLELVLAATQSVLGDEVDEDVKPVEHVAKSLRSGGGEGDGSPQGSLRRIDCVEADGAAPVKQTLTFSQANEISDESHADIALMTARVSTKFDTVVGNIDDLHGEEKNEE